MSTKLFSISPIVDNSVHSTVRKTSIGYAILRVILTYVGLLGIPVVLVETRFSVAFTVTNSHRPLVVCVVGKV